MTNDRRKARYIYAALETLEEHLCCSAGVPGCEPADFALAREFIWGDRFPQPVALITHGGTSGGFGGQSVPPGESVYHYLHDLLGSVVALTNATGQVVERYTYDPYGQTVIEATDPATGQPLRDPQTGVPTGRLAASAFGSPFAWTGQRYDTGVSLYQFLHRGYSPRLARWLQRDPAGYLASVSLYEYVSSDPVGYIDLYGLQPQQPPASQPSKRIPKGIRQALDDGWNKTKDTGKEAGGTLVRDKEGNEAGRGVATHGTGHANVPETSNPGDTIIGNFHTHPINPQNPPGSPHSPGDIKTILEKGKKDHWYIVESGECTTVVIVVDEAKARECAKNWPKVMQDMNKAKAECEKKAVEKKPKNQEEVNCLIRQCMTEVIGSTAQNCGYEVWQGCGGDKDNLHKVAP